MLVVGCNLFGCWLLVVTGLVVACSLVGWMDGRLAGWFADCSCLILVVLLAVVVVIVVVD